MIGQFKFSGFLLLGVLLATGAAADDLKTCIYESGDVALEACNRAINSGRYSGVDLSNAYMNRGAEWLKKGNYDRAIADSTTTIKLFPKATIAYENRGLAWKIKGDFKKALADYSAAIRNDPENPGPYIKRASLREEQGDRAGAIADLRRALATKPDKSKFVNVERFYGQAREALERLSKP